MLDQTTTFVFVSFILICVFVVIWIFIVAPSERRHHERKLEMVQKRIDRRQEALKEQQSDAESGQVEDPGD